LVCQNHSVFAIAASNSFSLDSFSLRRSAPPTGAQGLNSAHAASPS
jgi:hypothetical protein